jgi:hypothetical protein
MTALSVTILTVGIILSLLSSGLVDKASAAGQTKFIPDPNHTHGEVPEPPPLWPPRLSVRATNISWVTACADGKRVFERLLEAGDEVEIPFFQNAILRSGNAGGLEITLAGQYFSPMGPWGSSRMVLALPDGYDFVEPVLTNPCASR